MQFNIFFFFSLVAILTLFESSVSARPSPRRSSELSELSTRNGDALGLEPSYDMLFRRAPPKKTPAQAALRKAANRAVANKNGKGARGPVNPAKRASSQAAANAKLAARKQAGRNKFGAAAAAHRATTNMPGRKQQFKVPGGGPTFSGKQVRKAVFDSHMEREANRGRSRTQQRRSPLKPFGNSNHRQPNPKRPKDVKSINHMRGPGHEFPIGSTVNKGPARVITQQTRNGHTKFKGVVAHDVTRAPGSPGYNDHFQVRPTGSRKPRRK
jgi:hypothetical protein